MYLVDVNLNCRGGTGLFGPWRPSDRTGPVSCKGEACFGLVASGKDQWSLDGAKREYKTHSGFYTLNIFYTAFIYLQVLLLVLYVSIKQGQVDKARKVVRDRCPIFNRNAINNWVLSVNMFNELKFMLWNKDACRLRTSQISSFKKVFVVKEDISKLQPM